MAHGNLIRFSDAILKDAEEKRNIYMQELDKENSRLLNKRSSEIKQLVDKKVHRDCARISAEAEAGISLRKNEIALELINIRKEMFEEVFAKVRENITNYAKTAEYTEFLRNSFELVLKYLGDASQSFKCRARKCDIEWLRTEFSEYKIEFEEISDSILGGFILENLSSKRLVDQTFAERLENEKDRFFAESGLVLE